MAPVFALVPPPMERGLAPAERALRAGRVQQGGATGRPAHIPLGSTPAPLADTGASYTGVSSRHLPFLLVERSVFITLSATLEKRVRPRQPQHPSRPSPVSMAVREASRPVDQAFLSRNESRGLGFAKPRRIVTGLTVTRAVARKPSYSSWSVASGCDSLAVRTRASPVAFSLAG